MKPDTIGERDDWLRLVLAKADIDNARAMASRLAPGAVVLLDRHCNSLLPYHRGAPNVYAVWTGTQRAIRYVSVSSGRIIPQPDSRDWPVELVEIAHGKGFAEYIVGRVCHICSRSVKACATAALRIPSWVRASCEDAWVAARKRAA